MELRKKAYIYLVIALISWGSFYVAGKYVLEIIPSFTLLFLRYAIGIFVLLIFYRKYEKSKIEKKDYKYILLIGFAGYFLAIAFQLLGTHYCNASMASLINSMNPAMIILLAIPILHEKITIRKTFAVGITLIGTVVIIGNLGYGNTSLGVFFSFVSMIAWSLSSVIVRFSCQKYDSITVTIYGMIVGLIFSLPASIIELIHSPVIISDIKPTVIVWIFYIGIVCTAGGMLSWNKALELIDAATCSLFYPLQPLTSAFLGVLILGEVLSLNFIIGSILIVAGILYVVISEKIQ
ncbi:DMT family transporter [Anaerovorax odorimutans]|uniref:DMT family transporter n=1 Tax=Anaerovorax odorimutans TaxID=109327 RepID=UPI0004212FA9|nr:DMT family transporter [Anaerovorax odorimutans]